MCECFECVIVRQETILIGFSWAIRNCGLMLFRGLIDRLLGTSESLDDSTRGFATSSRLSWENYAGLLGLLANLLKPLSKINASSDEHADAPVVAERIFPILDLLKKALPPSSYREGLRASMLTASGSSHWHVRDIAARTYAATATLDDVVVEVGALLGNPFISQNTFHGRLLCVRYMCTAVVNGIDQSPNRKLSSLRTRNFSLTRCDGSDNGSTAPIPGFTASASHLRPEQMSVHKSNIHRNSQCLRRVPHSPE